MFSGILEGSSMRQWIPCPAQLWEEGVGRKQGEVHTPGLWEGKCRKADGALDSPLPALQSGGWGEQAGPLTVFGGSGDAMGGEAKGPGMRQAGKRSQNALGERPGNPRGSQRTPETPKTRLSHFFVSSWTHHLQNDAIQLFPKVLPRGLVLLLVDAVALETRSPLQLPSLVWKLGPLPLRAGRS